MADKMSDDVTHVITGDIRVRLTYLTGVISYFTGNPDAKTFKILQGE